MSSKVSQKDILQLFTGLKNVESTYPQDMVKARRDSFKKQAAAMAVLMKAGVSGSPATGTGQATAATSTTTGNTAVLGGMSMGTLLETVLVIALVAEAGVAAYIYREKIAEFFNPTPTPKIEQTENPINNPSQDFVASDEPSTAAVATETPKSTFTATATAIETPVQPGLIPSISQNNDQNGEVQVASTPVPTDSLNNGLHLGQTKQPTKESKKDNNSNGSGNNSKNKDK